MNKYSVRLFGQWLNFYNDFSTAECSNCGHCYETSIDGAINRMLFEGFKKEYKFCPNCGAKMCGLKNGTSEKIIDLDFNNQLKMNVMTTISIVLREWKNESTITI